jgi:hypothetical protein
MRIGKKSEFIFSDARPAGNGTACAENTAIATQD